MNFLEKIANYFDPSANESVLDINKELTRIQDRGLINAEERDALRHYLGIQSLVARYGDTVAWVSGIIHEGTDIIMPGEDWAQSKADRINNNIAIDHMGEGIHVKIEDLSILLHTDDEADIYISTYDKLQELLNVLEIPLPYGEAYNQQPQPDPNPQNKVTTFSSGYHPELDVDE